MTLFTTVMRTILKQLGENVMWHSKMIAHMKIIKLINAAQHTVVEAERDVFTKSVRFIIANL